MFTNLFGQVRGSVQFQFVALHERMRAHITGVIAVGTQPPPPPESASDLARRRVGF